MTIRKVVSIPYCTTYSHEVLCSLTEDFEEVSRVQVLYANIVDILEECHPKFSIHQFGGEDSQRVQAGVLKRRLNCPQPFDQEEVDYDQVWCPTEANPNGHTVYTAEQLDDPAVREELGVSIVHKSK